ncbi:Uncharacterised protein [Serratia entomophila]|uniref:hypothetical protein n=1 Tax=Serratia entomophila TaxID=42906 RepID=UPI001F257773|nr:hypothetical protein [Serratia entomophila]UIW19268.1 hypothetical protein KHA73_04775 [Serratia entomophila]CAI0805404.1 Uncharacterised protein [Serratia entomophila]CAI0822408.1 Uncharacterised protein [Serratia entomophila]CAI1028573.1 Uncharacterised protein [Serratia entomophila]CAI1032783.1 Uncharacterised protein [Serratia entomophila]
MDKKLSELSKPIGVSFKSDIDLMKSGRMIHGQMTVWKSTVGIPESQEGVYSQEYVSALLAELEAKDSEIDAANARVDVMCAKAMNLTERAEVAEQKLATPVRLPEPDVNDYGYESIGYRAVLSALSDAGVTFTVEGDE